MFDFFGSPAGYPAYGRGQPFVIPGTRPYRPTSCRCGSPFCSGSIENRSPKVTPRRVVDPFGFPVGQDAYRLRRPVEKKISQSHQHGSNIDERRQALRRRLLATKTIQRWWRGKMAQRRAYEEAKRRRISEEHRNRAAFTITRAVRNAAACRVPKRILLSLRALHAIQESSTAMVTKYLDRVMQIPAKDSKELLYLEDFLIKVLIQLDAVDSYGAMEVRRARKALIQDTQSILDQLDAHKLTPEPMELDSATEPEAEHFVHQAEESEENLSPMAEDSDEDDDYHSAAESDEEVIVPIEELLSEHFTE